MRDRPTGIGEREVAQVLAEHWHIEATSLHYAPVGGGSYHWVVRDELGGIWFATVDDLDDKAWLGRTRAGACDGLQAAMTVASELRYEAGLEFVVAPVPSLQGSPVVQVAARYTLAVFPYLDGSTGRTMSEFTDTERDQVIDMLAVLHRTRAPTRARPSQMALPRRNVLEAALGELDMPWHGGPFAESARFLLIQSAAKIQQMLATFDHLTMQVETAPEQVITHGEPHSGNILRAESGLMLIDWDTAALGPPERDLWHVVTDAGAQTRRYTEATGQPVDQSALEFYRIRWALDDISSFAGQLRDSHQRTAHTEHIWRGLQIYLSDCDPVSAPTAT
jgi:spectinomycin phosphotransferase